MPGVVVITDCDHDSLDPERAVLEGHDVELRRPRCRTPQEVADQAGDADVLIDQYVPITAEVLDALPRCRLVVRYWVASLAWGVVGCGAIGRAVARRAAGLGLRVLGDDVPQVRSEPPIERVPLQELLEGSDVVSLHAAPTAESHHLIAAAALAWMRPTAWPVNTALDVLEGEPPDELGWRLVRHPRVVATAHAAWYSEEAFHTLKTGVAREALRVLEGGRPRSPVSQPAAHP